MTIGNYVSNNAESMHATVPVPYSDCMQIRADSGPGRIWDHHTGKAASLHVPLGGVLVVANSDYLMSLYVTAGFWRPTFAFA